MHYQQFEYFTSGTDDELSDVMLPVPPDPVDADQVEPEAPMPSSDQSVSLTHHLPQLFSDHERARSPLPQTSSSEKQSSVLGTSAPLLTNPSLTVFLSNYPIRPIAPPIPLKSASSKSDDQSNLPSVPPDIARSGDRSFFQKGEWETTQGAEEAAGPSKGKNEVERNANESRNRGPSRNSSPGRDRSPKVCGGSNGGL